MTKETIKTFQYRITQATASQLVVILYDMAIEYLNDACESDSACLLYTSQMVEYMICSYRELKQGICISSLLFPRVERLFTRQIHMLIRHSSVSYTHLDVYKRQGCI